MRKGEMSGTCSTHGKRKLRTKCLSGNLNGRGHLGDPDVDARLILKYLK